MKHRLLKRLLTLVLLLYCLFLVVDLWIHRDVNFGDFRSCYYAGRAYRDGVIPYGRTRTWWSRHAQAEMLAFFYHPILLWVFAGVSFLGFETACFGHLLLSVVAVVGLIYLWKTVFAPRQSGLLLYALCLFGFNSALYRGFDEGNINTFDVALLWLGFHMFVKGRFLPFIVLIVVVSLGKGFPLLLLALLFLIEGRRKWRYVFCAALIVAGVHGVTYALHPAAFLEYAAQKVDVLVRPVDTAGALMPSTMHILKDILLPLAANDTIDFGLALILLTGSYLGIAITVVTISARALRRLTVEGPERRLVICVMASFVFALVLPHFKDYAYALLIPSAYVVITRQRVVSASARLAGMVMVPYLWGELPGVKTVGAFLIPYGVVFMTYALWLIYLTMLSRDRRLAGGPARASG